MSDLDLRTSAPKYLPIMPRANGFRKNMRVAEVPLFVLPQAGEQAAEKISYPMRDIRSTKECDAGDPFAESLD